MATNMVFLDLYVKSLQDFGGVKDSLAMKGQNYHCETNQALVRSSFIASPIHKQFRRAREAGNY